MDDPLDWDAITGEPWEGLLTGSDESLQLPAVKPKYWWQAGYVSDAEEDVGEFWKHLSSADQRLLHIFL